ncbi:hypothetical protein [Nostoc sp.]|uniref:hypothetical protein n=1 Tax=Nostoc sp. TaxID=1180 RepID=UPI002FF81CF0
MQPLWWVNQEIRLFYSGMAIAAAKILEIINQNCQSLILCVLTPKAKGSKSGL